MLLIRHFLVRCQNWLVIQIVIAGYKKPSASLDLVRLGSSYGGWWIPRSILEDNSKNRVLISAGLGFDVTFDKALLEAGFEVIGMDPLEDSVIYADGILQEYSRFTAVNMGLWTKTGIEKFFPPKNPSHDSWSTTNIQNSPINIFKEYSVTNIQDLIIKYPQIQNAEFVFLKMDIEGSEVCVLQDFKSFSREIDFLATEFDFLSLIPFRSIKKRIELAKIARQILRIIHSEGFQLIKTENYNLFWVAPSSYS